MIPLLLLLAAVPACPQALAAAPAARFCAAAPGGVALADTQAHADAMRDDAAVGETRFRVAFAAVPARYAIFHYDDPATIAATRTALRAAGYAVALPLPSPAFLAARRQQVAAALPPGATLAVRAPDPVSEPRDDRNHIPHELGHLWYAAAFWPAPVPVPGAPRHYGSAAPDWLDEAAAMLMEGDDRAALYRNRFADGRDPDRAAGVPPEVPLAEFIAMPHPALAGLRAAGPSAGAIRVTSAPTLFYSQAHVLADYLIDRSGEPRIIAALSTGLAGGTGFADWLARDGARHRLPSSLAAMDADWQAWLTARYGPPA